MVKEYLQKNRNKLLEEEKQLNEEYNKIDIQLKEIAAFLSLLEEKNDSCFESFSPYEVNSSNKGKIREQENKKRELVKQQFAISKKLEEIKNSIQECNDLLIDYENKTQIKNTDITIGNNTENEKTIENNSIDRSEIDTIIHNFDEIKKYRKLDIHRYFVEVDHLVTQLEKM